VSYSFCPHNLLKICHQNYRACSWLDGLLCHRCWSVNGKLENFVKLITAGHSGPHCDGSGWHSSIYITIRLSCSTVSESTHKDLAPLWQRVFSPTQCIISISVRYVCFICCTQDLTSLHKVGRMMMNIRGLIVDDPEHTLHLQTLEFTNRHRSGSEIEERGWGLVWIRIIPFTTCAHEINLCRSQPIPQLRMRMYSRVTISYLYAEAILIEKTYTIWPVQIILRQTQMLLPGLHEWYAGAKYENKTLCNDSWQRGRDVT